MSELIEQEAKGTELTPIERANAVLKSSDIELHFQSMAKEAKEISTITNKDGYEQCHATRMKLREERVELNKKAKAARDDANAFSKAVIAEEKRLITIIEPEEERLQGLQTVWDAEVKRKKEEKARLEAERVKKITDEIDRIRLMPYNSATDIPTIIEAVLETLKGQKPDSAFAEFEADAIVTWERACKELQELYARKLKQQEDAVALKIEQERVKAETEALAKERAEHDAKVEQARKQEAARMAALEKAERETREAEERARKAEKEVQQMQDSQRKRNWEAAQQAEIGAITNSDDFKKIFGEPEHEQILNTTAQAVSDAFVYGQSATKVTIEDDGGFQIKNIDPSDFFKTHQQIAFESILEVCRTWRNYEFPRLAIETIEKIAREQVEG